MSLTKTVEPIGNGLSDAVLNADRQYVMRTYGRLPVEFVRGSGARLYDASGREYLDFLAGISVNSVGHCHPRIVEAVTRQVATLMHTSNLYYSRPCTELARKLCATSGMEKAFFCNSGTEANEAAIKIARKHGKLSSGQKTRILTATGSFHGRTYGALSATAQSKYQDPFAPIVPGFSYVAHNDVYALQAEFGDDVCGIMLEPILGESGVFPTSKEFMRAARDLCSQTGALLIFDEVQTGMARTGKWWAFQHGDVVPDVMTSAKALGGGLPIGACLARGAAAETLVPGDHGSTFAGNLVAASSAIAVQDVIESEHLLENATRVGAYLMRRATVGDSAALITEVRGKGLMLGLQLARPIARELVTASLARGLVINAVGDSIIRLLPPLVIHEDDVDEAFDKMENAARELGG
jgi:predicted acetylornithine/succinylornithine family transaminase